MKCPTCGKAVKKGQAVCTVCGAMTGGPTPKSSAAKPSEFHPPSIEEKKFPTVGDRAAEEHERPPLEPMEDASHPELSPDTPEQSAPARPTPPAWVRFISPLFFILVFLATQFWLRDSEPSRSPRPEDSQPVLRQAEFAGDVPDGQAVETRTTFSLQDDQQIVFISTWGGSPRGHSYAVEWYSPGGATHPSSNVLANTAPEGGGFSVIATLELDASLPLGEWHVEVSQDGKVVSQYIFRLKQ